MIVSQNGESSTGSTGLLEWQLEYQAGVKTLVLRTSGPIDKTSFPSMLAAAVAAAERHQTNRILADCRRSPLRLNPLEIYYSPRVIQSSGAHSNYIIAMVFAEMTEDIQFMENVCRNSGLTLATFTDFSSGLQWVSDPTTPIAGRPPLAAALPEKPTRLQV